MNILQYSIHILIVIFLSGCSTTGGTIGGLFPAPKFLKGSIEKNIYSGKDNLFTISVPHKEETYEFKYMEIKELYKENNAYVSFGPAAFDKSIYRVEISLTQNDKWVNLSNSEKVIESYKEQLHKQYTTYPIIQKRKEIKINGYDAIFWELKQEIPIGKHWSNKKSVFYHYAYVINYKIGVGTIWVQIPIDTSGKESGIEYMNFVKSLKIKPKKFN